MANSTGPDGLSLTSLQGYRTLTRQFPGFFGLRLVPVGTWFLLAPALGPFEATPAHYVLAALAVLGSGWIHLGYRRRLGTVQPVRASLGRARAILAGVAAAFLALSAATLFPGSHVLVVALVLILLTTAGLLVQPLSFGAGGRMSTWAVWVVAALGGAAIVIFSRSPSSFGGTGDLICFVLGAFVCLAGIVEHRSLIAALPAPADGDE